MSGHNLPITPAPTLTPLQFMQKWLLKFADNEFERIDEETLREFTLDCFGTFPTFSGLNVKMVKGATYPVPFTDALGTIPPAYRVLGMQAMARTGVDAATAGAGVTADPVYFQLVRDSDGGIDALLDEELNTVATTRARWVKISGPDDEKVASFPVLLLEDETYKAGDIRRYTFPGGQTRLVQWKADSVGYTHPEPTGEDSDPIYRNFAPLQAASAGTTKFAGLTDNPMANALLAALLTARPTKAQFAATSTISPSVLPNGNLVHKLIDGSITLDHLAQEALDQLVSQQSDLPLTNDTLAWHEADNPHALGFLKNKVPASRPGIYDLQSTTAAAGGAPVSPTTPLRKVLNLLNGYPAVAFENNAASQPDRVTYNCKFFNTLVGGARPGTVTFLLRNRSTQPAGTSGRVLGGFSPITFGLNYEISSGVTPNAGSDWVLFTIHFTWLTRAFVYLNGRYVGALAAGNDYIIGNQDGGTMTWFHNWTGDVAAFIMTQDSSRPAGLLHENYLREKYGLS